MRFPRIKPNTHSFHQCSSRVVEGRFIFALRHGRSVAAEKFLSIMRPLEAFTGIRVLEYVIMGDHFHLLCEVPEPRPLSQEEMLQRIGALYGPRRVRELREKLAGLFEQSGGVELCRLLLEPFRKRMNDISIFIKELKGGFAQWYNRHHGRSGVLWTGRFKSVLLQGGHAVAKIAAYLVLNPVRAGLCEDPKEYRYCGYAEALAKRTAAVMERIRIILGLPPTTSPKQIAAEYRKELFLRGSDGAKAHSPAFDITKAEAVVEQEKGELSLQARLRCKIRYFTDGVILGSREFVQSHCQQLEQRIGYKRKSGPTALKIFGPATLWVFRNLRVRRFG
jgi:REP-associated tyrosine transposase